MSTMKLLTAALVVGTLLGPGVSPKAGHPLDKKLPSLQGLHRYGCKIVGPVHLRDHRDPRQKTKVVWQVSFWAEHKTAWDREPRRDWNLLYSYRDKRRKGLDDCDRFLQRMQKVRRLEENKQAAAKAIRKVNTEAIRSSGLVKNPR